MWWARKWPSRSSEVKRACRCSYTIPRLLHRRRISHADEAHIDAKRAMVANVQVCRRAQGGPDPQKAQ